MFVRRYSSPLEHIYLIQARCFRNGNSLASNSWDYSGSSGFDFLAADLELRVMCPSHSKKYLKNSSQGCWPINIGHFIPFCNLWLDLKFPTLFALYGSFWYILIHSALCISRSAISCMANVSKWTGGVGYKQSLSCPRKEKLQLMCLQGVLFASGRPSCATAAFSESSVENCWTYSAFGAAHCFSFFLVVRGKAWNLSKNHFVYKCSILESWLSR